MNSTPLFIARRLSLGPRGSGRRSAAGIFVAVAGIALAMVVMMVSIAVMKGFKTEIRNKVTGFEAQLSVKIPPPASQMSVDGTSALSPGPITMTPALNTALDTLRAEGFPLQASLTVSRPVILKTSDAFKGVVATGSDNISDLAFIAAHVTEGAMPDLTLETARNSLVISQIAASELGVKPGESLSAYFFGRGGVRVRKLKVSAVYDTRFSDYDRTAVFASAAMLRGVDRFAPDEGTRIDLRGLPDADVDDATARLQRLLLENLYNGNDTTIYQVDNVHQRGALYFNWLDLLDTNVTVILLLMAIVAAFTLISSLFIIILERVRMIGILKALGASNAFIRRIFILTAERIVLRGMAGGNLIGLFVIYLQERLHLVPLDPDTYYLSYVPVSIGLSDIIWLNIGVIVVSLLVLIIPSQLVASVSPARTMRYE